MNPVVALVQSDPCFGNTDKSLSDLEKQMDGFGKADIFILPEMFATGLTLDPATMYQTMDGIIVQWLKRQAALRNALVCGTAIICEDGRYYNRLCATFPDGRVETYDKRHLFTYSGENMNFTAGDRRVIIRYAGLRIMLIICYDLRFPVFCRNRDDYDMIICVANWPVSRMLSWDVLLRARAIENQCFVAGVNRVGDDDYCHYEGHSQFISPYGEILAQAEIGTVQVISAAADLEKLAHFRNKFPVGQDADSFECFM